MDLSGTDRVLSSENPSPVLIPTEPDGRSGWLDEHTLYLLELHPQQLSNSQMACRINEKFGTKYTRNAVIGKCSRLGLPSRPKPKPSIFPTREVQPRNRKRISPHTISAVEPTIEPEFICDPVSFLDLQQHHCRWPVNGDIGPIMFCGDDKLEPLSYCPRHCRLAFHSEYKISERERARRHFQARRATLYSNTRKQLNLDVFYTE